MKNINKLFALVVALSVLSSCAVDDSILNVSTDQIEFNYVGGQHALSIESNGDWSIYELPEWLVASKQSGIGAQEVILTASENTLGLDREAVLSIRNNDNKIVLPLRVVQYANAAGRVFSIDDTSQKYFNGGTSMLEYEDSIVIHSSGKWKITGPEWLSMKYKGASSVMQGQLREGSGTIYFSCRRSNNNAEARYDKITIETETGDGGVSIPVVQLGLYDVKCVNMRVLSDGLWTYFKYGRDAQFIQFGIIEGVISAEEMSNKQYGSTASLGNVVTQLELKPNTDYTICTRVMPAENKVYMQKVNIEVIHTPSEFHKPRATIEDVYYGEDNKWHCSTVMNEYARGYCYLWYKNNNLSKAHYAYLSYRYNKEALLNNFTQESATWNIPNDNVTLLTWAMGENGELSDVVDIYKFYADGNASAPQFPQYPKLEHIGTMNVSDLEREQLLLITQTQHKK